MVHAPAPLDAVSESRRLRKHDVRMIVGIPALLVLLTIGMGVANYWVYLELADRVNEAAPTVDTTQFQSRILVVLLVFSFLAAISGGALVYTVLRPLRALTEAVNRLAQGRLHEPVSIPSGMFEVDQLGKTFNSMVGFINSVIEEREDILSEWSQGGSLIVTDAGQITSVNDEGLRLMDAERDELVGHTLDQIAEKEPELAPGLLGFVRHAVERAGTVRDCEVHVGAASDALLSVTCSPLHDHGHGPRAFLIHFHDARVVRDLNQLFSRTDHLAALGTFTVGLSHELRNPLATLKGNAQLLGSQVGAESRYTTYVDRMVREIDRLDLLVRELYDFSRIPVEQSEEFSLQEMAHQVLDDARQAHEGTAPDVELREELDPTAPKAYGQAERIRRALRNLVDNAFQHTPEGGSLTVRVMPCDTPTPRCVTVEVANTGSRIPDENIQRVFEPFFSTRPGGTGLGLAIAYQIVAQNRGTLQAASDANSVTMRIRLRGAPDEARQYHGEDDHHEQ